MLRIKCLIALIVIGCLSCSIKDRKEEIQRFKLHNESSNRLKDKGVSILLKDLNYSQGFPKVSTSKGVLIPAQIDDTDGDGVLDELFLVWDFEPNQILDCQIEWTEFPTDFHVRTAVRFGKRDGQDQPVTPRIKDTFLASDMPKNIGYQPYQTDGPTWENDKVGFRHYFDGRNSKDLFGKKTNLMSPSNVGLNSDGAVEDNYHVMEDWGRDILAVGNSVGLGGITLLKDDQPARLGVLVNDELNNIRSTSLSVLANGPIRSIIHLEYNDWKAFGRTYPKIEEKISIVPGMYAYKNEVRFNGLQGDEMVAIGLVNIHNDKGIRVIQEFEEWVLLMTHDAQGYDKEWIIGMALILPKSKFVKVIDAPSIGTVTNSYLAKMNSKNGESLTYYAVGAWELSDDGFKDEVYFEKYLGDLVTHLESKVVLKK